MAKRLAIKKKKRRLDMATAYAKGLTPRGHKVARSRSRKAKFRKINPA